MNAKTRLQKLEAKAKKPKNIWDGQITTIQVFCVDGKGGRELLEVYSANIDRGGWDCRRVADERKN